MNRSFRAAFQLALAVLLALSPGLHVQDTDGRATHCTPGGCAPPEGHRLAISDAGIAVAAAIGRTTAQVPGSFHRPDTRAGVDLLFRARADLMLARAQVSLEEYRSTVLSLRPVRLGRSATASRAPPFLI